MTVDVSKNSGGEKMHNIEHVLNPKKLFTKKCTNEEKHIQEILQSICALRNSGGGKLTIRLKETCSRSEIEECVKIIRKAAVDVLSKSKESDFLKWQYTKKLLNFSIKGSEEISTMKYNMYIMENEVAKLVPSTKSAAEVRLLLQKRKGKPVAEYNTNTVGVESNKLEKSTKPEYENNDTTESSLVSSKSPILHFVKDARVKIPAEDKFAKIIHFESLKNTSTTEKSA